MKGTDFGKTRDGRSAQLYVLKNANGAQAHITDYGATLVRLLIPDKNGEMRDVVLGYEDVSGYEKGTCFFGGTIGRFANRIGGAKFEMNGQEYSLEVNDGVNSLHGGRDFYNDRIWQTKAFYSMNSLAAPETSSCPEDCDAVMFELDSPDADQGYPGAIHIEVIYYLTDENELRITYHAAASQGNPDDGRTSGCKDFCTPLNLTNHSYFNLNGDGGSVLDHIVTIYADEFTPTDSGSIPTGEIRSLDGSPLDFRVPKPIGRDIEVECDQLKMAGGYDHNYVLRTGSRNDGDSQEICEPAAAPETETLRKIVGCTPEAAEDLKNYLERETEREQKKRMRQGMCEYRKAAQMYSEKSGICMNVYTDLPGMQFYTANYVESEAGKDGKVYGKRSGACFETQFWPDCVNKENFPGGVLKAGEEFISVTAYEFTLI